MKLTATIRPIETRTTIAATGEDYVQTRDTLLASVPAGFEIVGAISTVHESAPADTPADGQLLNARPPAPSRPAEVLPLTPAAGPRHIDHRPGVP